ncbi:MAG: DNA recombination protein RmuC [Actinobacteria bacterium]|nr:DNA recombination protein RmuC [Actinomycetota bacterium]
MTNILIGILIFISIIILILVILKKPSAQNGKMNEALLLIDKNQERLEKSVKDEISRNRLENTENLKITREELGNSFKNFNESTDKRLADFSIIQTSNFDTFSKKLSELTEKNEYKMEQVRLTVEGKLENIQKDNSEKLEKMRQTVEEKLEATLETRLGEKFKLVNDRLEQVYKGLGEMQTLASGVGDLKKVLTNVKSRGTWGEVQLGNLLEQLLIPEQYATNVCTKKGSSERVEFAIRIPGKDDHIKSIWLPIDAKFPVEDYQKLVEAQENADACQADTLGKALEARIKNEAKDIKEKYLDPPYTTDFGILFLPIEGLFAEVVRRMGLVEFLQNNYRVIVTGPTTIAALLNSLQMGFRTLAIEKRTSEVWEILGAVKNDFGKFGEILEKTHKKLKEASDNIETATSKTRSIERKLNKVQALPTGESKFLDTDDISNNEKAQEV